MCCKVLFALPRGFNNNDRPFLLPQILLPMVRSKSFYYDCVVLFIESSKTKIEPETVDQLSKKKISQKRTVEEISSVGCFLLCNYF